MNKKTKKQLGMVAALVLLLAISGCGTMMFLFGDNLGYSISGRYLSTDIDKSRLVKSEGLLLSYKLDIRLDPK